MRVTTESQRTVRFGIFEVDLEAAELRKSGLRIHLQEQPFRILQKLLENPGSIVTREELKSVLSPSAEYGDFDQMIRIGIWKLRKALSDDAQTPRYIETVAQHGYRFVYPVIASNGGRESSPSTRQPSKKSFWIAFLLLFGLVTVALVAGRTSLTKWLFPARPIQSIAVLPLQNLSKDRAEEYFAEGITDELITALARVEGLRTLSRTSTKAYRGTAKPVPVIARELGVDAIVEGSVLKQGNRVRINVQLIRAKPESHVWAESFEGELADSMVLQAQAANAIVVQAERSTSAAAKEGVPAQPRFIGRRMDVEALNAYLLGSYYYDKQDPESLRQARRYLEQATSIEHGYAAAWEKLAEVLSLMASVTSEYPNDVMPEADIAIKVALNLDPQMAEAYSTRAWIKSTYFHDWAAAEADYRYAIKLNPKISDTHRRFGWFLLWLGRFGEASQELKTAQELEPNWFWPHRNLAMFFYCRRQYDEAMKELKLALQLSPNNIMVLTTMGQVTREAGNYEQAIKYFATAREKAPGGTGASATGNGQLGMAYALAGRREEALRILHELEKQSETAYVGPTNMARIYVGLGEKDKALDWLDEAYKVRDIDICVINVSPVWDRIRSESRFQQLLRKVGF